MCAPLALGGLQVASQIAGAAAQARQFRHEAQRVERAARADAAAAAARAEFARDEAERRSASSRSRAPGATNMPMPRRLYSTPLSVSIATPFAAVAGLMR